MAKYMPVTGVDIKWIFNVSYPVGPLRTNARDDVMLVQHALNAVMPYLDIKDRKGQPLTRYLVRDGYFGPLTHEAILGYQENLKNVRKKVVIVDGGVDPADSSGWNPRGSAQYTIVYLNRDHRDFQGRMMDEKDFPELLRAALERQSR